MNKITCIKIKRNKKLVKINLSGEIGRKVQRCPEIWVLESQFKNSCSKSRITNNQCPSKKKTFLDREERRMANGVV